MPIKLTPQSFTSRNRLWTAEVTPPEGGGRPWRSPGPMKVGELMAALRTAGCSQADIDKALRDAAALYSQAFMDADANEKYEPAVRAALSGEHEPPPRRPFTEPLVAYVLFSGKKPASLAGLVDTADFIDHGPPSPDELAWALLRLKKRGWLVVNGDLYGLTADGKRIIAGIIGQDGPQFDQVKRLEGWTSSHPP
jgi:hypothetical protein